MVQPSRLQPDDLIAGLDPQRAGDRSRKGGAGNAMRWSECAFIVGLPAALALGRRVPIREGTQRALGKPPGRRGKRAVGSGLLAGHRPTGGCCRQAVATRVLPRAGRLSSKPSLGRESTDPLALVLDSYAIGTGLPGQRYRLSRAGPFS